MKLVLAAMILLSSACAGAASRSYDTENPAFKVDMLFESEGCRVYRFRDNGSTHYYANCRGGFSNMSDTVMAGKTPVYRDFPVDAR